MNTARCNGRGSPRRGAGGRRGSVRLLLLALSALVSFAALAAPALADVQTIDFESGALNAPLESQGDISFPLGLGFRPYRAEVGAGRAHSGTRVGDLTRCVEEQEARGANPGECEFFRAATTARLARSATLVRVFAGRFDQGGSAERAILTGFDAQGQPVQTTGPVAINDRFTTPLEVSSPEGRIVSFRLEAAATDGQSAAGDLGVDDVTVAFAAGGSPDFSIAAPSQVLAIVQGQQLEVPIQIQRLNGSTGPIRLDVSGLPAGVSAAPVTLPGGQSTATLVLRATANAPDTNFNPAEVTVTGTPQDVTVGSQPRTTSFLLRVATDFVLGADGVSQPELGADGKLPIGVPDCAALDVPVTVSRDLALAQDVSLSLVNPGTAGPALPSGLSAEFLPSPVVAPGGNVVAARTLRIRADWHALGAPYRLPLVVRGTAAGSGSTHSLSVELVRTPEASVAGGTLGLDTPRFAKPGTKVRVHGNGFCPHTRVEVGNEEASAPATLVDEHTIEFEVPRLATDGAVKVDPPEGLPGYGTANQLTIDSFRNDAGFRFANFGGGDLSFSEFREAFGDDDLFVKVNPCWPFGDCTVSTGLPDPIAAIELGVFDQLLPSGRCFGFGLTSQELRTGKVSYARLASPGASPVPSRVFDLSGSNGPNAALGSRIDANQVKQYSDQFITAYARRKRGLPEQLQTLEAEFAHNRSPMVLIARNGSPDGHAVLAYDMTQTATTADIYVYDPNRPFQPEVEEGFSGPLLHKLVVNEAVIHVNKELGSWSFTFTNDSAPWTGGNQGSLWVVPAGTVPDDPSLPGLDTATSLTRSVIFGSSPGAVRTLSSTAGAEELGAEPGVSGTESAGGLWRAPGGRSLRVTFEGRRAGHYTQVYAGSGFVAAVGNVATAPGVDDRVLGAGGAMTFASGEDRPLRLKLARRSGKDLTSAATLRTSASAAGRDTVGLGREGALSYSHDGRATQVKFTLSEIRRDGGPQTFVSPPVRLRGGERMRASALDPSLSRVMVSIRRPDGSESTRVLRNRASAHRRLRLGAARVSGRRVAIGFRLSGFHRRAIVGLVLRLVRGGHVLARRAVSLRAADGRHRFAWRLPRRLARGRYRLLADGRAIGGGGRGFTASGTAGAQHAVTLNLR
jgi:hypothetical protein